MLAGRGRDRDGDPPAGSRHARELAGGAAVVVDVLHHLGADHAVEAPVARRAGGRRRPGASRRASRGSRARACASASTASRSDRESRSRPTTRAPRSSAPKQWRPSPQPASRSRSPGRTSSRSRSTVSSTDHLLEDVDELRGGVAPSGRGARPARAPRGPCARSRSGSAAVRRSRRPSRARRAAERAARRWPSRADDLGQRPRRVRDHREPAGHRLARREAEALEERRHHRDPRRRVLLDELGDLEDMRFDDRTRSSSPKLRIRRGTSPWSGNAAVDDLERHVLGGSIESASSIVPMPFLRSSVRPTKSRSASFATSGDGPEDLGVGAVVDDGDVLLAGSRSSARSRSRDASLDRDDPVEPRRDVLLHQEREVERALHLLQRGAGRSRSPPRGRCGAGGG